MPMKSSSTCQKNPKKLLLCSLVILVFSLSVFVRLCSWFFSIEPINFESFLNQLCILCAISFIDCAITYICSYIYYSSLLSSSNLYVFDPFFLGSSSYIFFLVSSISYLLRKTRLSSSLNVCWFFRNYGVFTKRRRTFIFYIFCYSAIISSLMSSSFAEMSPDYLAVAEMLRPTLSAP